MVVYIKRFKCNEDIASQFSGYDPEWSNNENRREVFKDILDLLNSSEVLLAWYGGGCYDGEACVVYKSEGRLYEVNGSHCSCYGLEDRWKPDGTNKRILSMRSSFDDSEFEEVYKEMLDVLENDE